MLNKLKEVRPEDFDVEMLEAASREGRLFVAEQGAVNPEQVINNVRAYVQSLKPIVTPKFKSSVDDLWEDIFSCEELLESIMPTSKDKKCREMSKRGVKGIICVLINNGVYKEYNSTYVDRLLEHTDADSSSRRYLTKGVANGELRRKIRGIVEKYKV